MSGKNTLTPEQLRNSLQVPNFHTLSTLPAAKETDPITPTLLRVPVDIELIDPYDRNPRTARNEEYDRIKDSIRVRGMDSPLVVTRRPGGARYMIAAGGNTRLIILKELFEEARDSRYQYVHCKFVPWSTESDTLVAHIVENELRGALIFIDKARAITALRKEFEREANQPVSQRDLERRLRKQGLNISARYIARFDYTVTTLHPLLPEALQAGMGPRHVDAINNIEKAARRVWTDHPPAAGRGSHAGAFDALFSATLQALDEEELTPDEIQQSLEEHIAERLTVPIRTVRMAMDVALNAPDNIAQEAPAPAMIRAPEDTDPAPLPLSSHATPVTPRMARAALPVAAVLPPITPPPAAPYGDHGEMRAAAYSTHQHPAPTDIKSLRARCCVLATQLARHYHLDACIQPTLYCGFGYVLDLPTVPIVENKIQHRLWWFLLSTTGQVEPERELVYLWPKNSRYRQLLNTAGGESDAYALIGAKKPNIAYEHAYFWNALDDTGLGMVFRLIEALRQLNQVAQHAGIDLWEVTVS